MENAKKPARHFFLFALFGFRKSKKKLIENLLAFCVSHFLPTVDDSSHAKLIEHLKCVVYTKFDTLKVFFSYFDYFNYIFRRVNIFIKYVFSFRKQKWHTCRMSGGKSFPLNTLIGFKDHKQFVCFGRYWWWNFRTTKSTQRKIISWSTVVQFNVIICAFL